MNIKSVLIVVLALILALCPAAWAEDYEAGTMRLLRYEGTVEIFDPAGQPRFVLENARFSSGETMRTGENSLASVSLDDSKILTQDQNTQVQFIQEGSHMLLKLIEGEIFLDVQKKLDTNETLDIQTTTMTVGIRGTMLGISETLEKTKLIMIQGTGRVELTDASGAHRIMDVNAGTVVTLEHAGPSSAVTPSISTMTRDNISRFVLDQVLSDEGRITRVMSTGENGQSLILDDPPVDNVSLPGDTAEPFPAKGSWIISDPVTLVARSASKIYDGTPLTRPDGVLVSGLPQGMSISVSAKGSQTEAGTSYNVVENGYRIFNSSNEDVTAHFTNIKTVSGSLVVEPIPLTIWTGSAEKYYDGQPLTDLRAELKAAPGYQEDDPAWRNTSLVSRTAMGSETMIAVCGTTLVHATNPLDGKPQNRPISAGNRLSVSIEKDENGNDAMVFTVEKLAVDELPDEVLRLYADNPDLMAQACEDAEWSLKDLEARVKTLKGQSGTQQFNGLQVTGGAVNDLMTDSADVRITLDSDIIDYNGRPLKGNEAHFTPIRLDSRIEVTATGSQTAVGTSENTYTINWNGANPNNYQITAELGKLTVLPLREGELALTAPSDEKVYDGSALIAQDVQVTGLPNGYTVKATVNGSQTDAGVGINRVTAYQILNEKGEDATKEFANIHVLNGRLTVRPAPLHIVTGSASKVYDGTPLTCSDVTVTGLVSGESVTVTPAGTITQAGQAKNTYIITWDGAKARNYAVTDELGTLTVTASTASITLTAPSASKAYDGQPLTAGEATASGLPAGFTFTATVFGSQTDAGESETAITQYAILDADGNDATGNFSGVSLAPGKLTVTPAALTITTDSASKPYDGTPLTAAGITVSGLAEGESVTAAATGSITEAGTAENTYSIEWTNAKKENYTITENLGTLEVTANTAAVTFTAASGSKTYDGTALTASGVTASGLPDGFTFTASASGSQTDAGTGTNTVSSYQIFDGDGSDVTASFTSVSTVNGALTVNPAPLTVTTGTAEKVYDGEALTSAEASLAGLIGDETATISATGSQTKAGSSENGYTIDWGTAKEGNYTVSTENKGTLTVNALSLELNCGGAEATYSGGVFVPNPTITYLNGSHAGESVTGTRLRSISMLFRFTLFTGDTVDFTITGAGSDAGTYTLTGSATSSSEDMNLSMNFTGTTLTIKPGSLTIKTPSANKAYDGTPLTAGPATVTGLADGESITVTPNGTITDVGTADNTYDIDWGEVNKDNYTITNDLGTLEVTANTDEITFTAPSSSKTYDGAALTPDATAVTASGLPSGLTFTATVSGSQTDAGSSASKVTGWIIKQGEKNVTESFTNVKTTDGTLTVNQKEINITTGEGSKPYDGTALTNSAASITGLVSGENPAITATGTQTDVGESDNTYEIAWGGVKKDNYKITENLGKLTVTANDTHYVITSGTSSREYVPYDLTNSTFTVEPALPDGFTLEVNITGTQYVAGTSNNTIESYTIRNGNGEVRTGSFTGVETKEGTLTVTKAKINVWSKNETFTYSGASHAPNVSFQGVFVADSPRATDLYISDRQWVKDAGVYNPTFTAVIIRSDLTDRYEIGTITFGTITIDPAPLTVKTEPAEKTYDGTALTNPAATITGLISGETATITATGSQTDVGESDNTYEIAWGSAKEGNYAITSDNVHLGKLIVTANTDEITFTAPSSSKTYDGTALTPDAAAVTVSGLPSGFTFTATVDGSQTNVGSSASKVSGWTIKQGEKDVTASFTNVKTTDGTLTVNQKEITITTGEGSKPYDGTALTNATASIEGLVSSETATITATGRQTDVGESDNTYEIAWGTAKEANYAITSDNVHLGKLKVTENTDEITFTAPSPTKTYDGAALTPDASQVTVSGLPSGLTFTATVSGSQKDAGSSPSTVTGWTILNGSKDVTSYFTNITAVDGTLTVSRKEITVSTGTAEKTYDGTPLTAAATVTGLAGSETLSVSTASVTDAGPAVNNTYTIDWSASTAKESNYTVSTDSIGTLTVTPKALKVSTGSGEKTYDGTPLTNATATVTGLVSGETIAISATGSITDADSITNPYAIDWDASSAKQGNYEVTETDLGTLLVNKAKVTITTQSKSKVYDGAALPDSTESPTVEGTFYESVISIDNTTEAFSDVGTKKNTCKVAWNGANEDNYDVTIIEGDLTITPLGVLVTAYGYDSVYGRVNLPETIEAEYTNATGDITGDYNPEYSDTAGAATFSLKGGGVLQVVCEGVTSAGTGKSFSPTFNLTSGNANNYEITVTSTTFNITLLDVEIDIEPDDEMNPDELEYNGEYQYGRVDVYCDVEDYTVEKTSENTWRITWDSLSDVITVTVTGGGKDVGGYDLSCSTSCSTSGNLNIIPNGLHITIQPRALEVTTDGDEKPYDGTALTNATASIDGLVSGETATITATGTQTDVGESDNTYEITWDGTAKQSNYEVTVEDLGKLIVTENTDEITFTAPSSSKTYDGAALTPDAADVTASGLPSGLTFTATVSGSQTNVGSSSASKVTGWTILNGSKDVTSWFTNITLVDGTLTVDPAALTVSTGTASKTYDGTPLTAAATVTGLAGSETLSVITASVTDAGPAVDNTYTIDWEGSTAQVGNYTVSTGSIGTLTVNKKALKLTTGSSEKTYDGTPLTNSTVTIEGLVSGETIAITATGSITDAGSKPNTYAIDWDGSSAKQGNYEFTEIVVGTLLVKKAPITVTTKSYEITYGDGYLPDTTEPPTITGTTYDDLDFEYTAETFTDAGSKDNTAKLHCYEDESKAANYDVTWVFGTLTIKPYNLTVETGSAEGLYGEVDEVTNDWYTYYPQPLPNDETITIIVTGKQTEKGESDNTFDIVWGETNKNNYNVIPKCGKLRLDDFLLAD